MALQAKNARIYECTDGTLYRERAAAQKHEWEFQVRHFLDTFEPEQQTLTRTEVLHLLADNPVWLHNALSQIFNEVEGA